MSVAPRSLVVLLSLGLVTCVEPGAEENAGEGTSAAEPELCEEVGTKSCRPGAPLVELTCVDDMGETRLEERECGAMSECVEGQGCVPCTSVCAEGELRCAVDPLNIVVGCEPASPAGCHQLVPSLDCRDVGLSTCVDPGPLEVNEIQDYCVNECGARNIPLEHHVCDRHDIIGCAVWVCDPQTQGLVPDHTSCSLGGAPCTQNSDCTSCSCQAGVCIGNTVQSCNAACQ